REATALANWRCAMMRSSPTAGSANRSPVAATVDRRWQGVNSELTQLSTEAERFFARYRYPDWLVTHSRVVGRIAPAFAEARGAGRRAPEPEVRRRDRARDPDSEGARAGGLRAPHVRTGGSRGAPAVIDRGRLERRIAELSGIGGKGAAVTRLGLSREEQRART